MRNATKCRSSYLVDSKGVFAGGLIYETQQHHEKVPLPRSIRHLRFDGVCPIHGSSCRQEGQDGANVRQRRQQASLLERPEGFLRQVEVSRILLQQVCRCVCFYRRERRVLRQVEVSWMLLEGCLCFYGRQGCFLQQVCFKRLLL